MRDCEICLGKVNSRLAVIFGYFESSCSKSSGPAGQMRTNMSPENSGLRVSPFKIGAPFAGWGC